MVQLREFKSISSLADTKKWALNSSFIYATDGVLVVDTYLWDDTKKTAHASSGSTKRGFFNIYFENLSAGDLIEAECEFRTISGAAPRLSVDERNTDASTATSANKIYTAASGLNGWERVTVKHIAKNEVYSNYAVGFGLWSSMVGEFEVRNMRAVVHRNHVVREKIFSYEKFVAPSTQVVFNLGTVNRAASFKLQISAHAETGLNLATRSYFKEYIVHTNAYGDLFKVETLSAGTGTMIGAEPALSVDANKDLLLTLLTSSGTLNSYLSVKIENLFIGTVARELTVV